MTTTTRTDESLLTLLAILGHDLRNPLNAITMGAELLLRAPDTSPQNKRVVERIAHGALRMERLIMDVVDLAATQAGNGLPVERGEVDLDGLCRHVVAEHELCAPGQVRYASEGAGRGSWDPVRIAQVVQNLLANAVKHGEADAPIDVLVGGDAERAYVQVTNRGERIPDDVLPTIFDPFSRGATRDGLGLGLYIVHEIARAHGGTVEVCSDDESTTFRVELPRS